MAQLPAGATIYPISQPLLLEVQSGPTFRSFAMAFDPNATGGSSIYYLVAGPQIYPQWLPEQDVVNSSIG